MSDRHEKWTPMDVENTVIRSSRPPWRIEFTGDNGGTIAFENYRPADFDRMVEDYGQPEWFVDSSWKPPLELPTEPTWGIVVPVPEHYRTIPVARFRVEQTEHGKYLRWAEHASVDVANVRDFIPLTPEQVARIEAAR